MIFCDIEVSQYGHSNILGLPSLVSPLNLLFLEPDQKLASLVFRESLFALFEFDLTLSTEREETKV